MTKTDPIASEAEIDGIERIGFIGLGDIGLPMGERLLAAGHRICVHLRAASRDHPESLLVRNVADSGFSSHSSLSAASAATQRFKTISLLTLR